MRDEFDESEVREKVATAEPNSAFVVEPGAQWTLTDTLEIPRLTGLYAFDFVASRYTFNKGFDGTLAHVRGNSELNGVTFQGNKREGYTGDGVVVGDEEPATPFAHMSQVRIELCAGDGLVLDQATFWSYFEQVYCYANGGWGLRHTQTPIHYSQNLFDRCQSSKGDKGGIFYETLDHDTAYNGLTLANNNGPAIEYRDSAFEIVGLDGYNLTMRNTNFVNNEGPVWVHRGGKAKSIVFEDCQMVQNASAPSSDLTAPVGQFHVENDSVDIEIRGGVATGPDFLYTATKASDDHDLVIDGSRQEGLRGNIYGPNTYLTLQNTNLIVGDINVKSGIGLNPKNQGNIEHYGPLEELEGPAIYAIEKKSLSIDGDVTDLANVANLSLLDDFSVFAGDPTVSGPMWLTWDSSNLYLAADLTDNVHSQPHTVGRLYSGDCIQLGVADDVPAQSTTFAEFTIALGANGPQVVKRVIPGGGSLETLDVPAEIVRDDRTNTTLYEIAIPWSEVPTKPSEDRFGASMTVADFDQNNARSGLLECSAWRLYYPFADLSTVLLTEYANPSLQY